MLSFAAEEEEEEEVEVSELKNGGGVGELREGGRIFGSRSGRWEYPPSDPQRRR